MANTVVRKSEIQQLSEEEWISQVLYLNRLYISNGVANEIPDSEEGGKMSEKSEQYASFCCGKM